MQGKQIATNLFWKFSERFAAQIVSTIVSIVLARILMPEDYGMVSLVLVFITIADVFVVNGLGNSLIQKNKPDDLDYSSVLWVNVTFAILLYFVLYFSAPTISSFYGYPEMILIIRVFSLRLIVASINSVQHAYVSKTMQFKKYFWSTLIGTILSGCAGIMLAFRGFGPWALVAQYMTNSIVDTIVLFITVEWRPKLIFSFKRVVPLLSYGWKILFEAVTNSISTQLRNLIIGKRYSSSDLAYFSKGQQFPSLFINNVSAAISSVLFPAMSNINSNIRNVKILMRKSVRFSSYILFPLLGGFAMVAPSFVSVILTDKWLPMIPYLRIFCLLFILEVGMYPRHEALKSMGRSDIYMNEHIVYRIVDILLLFLFINHGVMYILLTHLFSVILLSIIIMCTSCKYTNYLIKEQIIDILKPVIMTLIMCVIVLVPSSYIINPLFLLIAQIVLGGVVYLILSWLIKDDEFLYIIRIINKGRKKNK